MIVSFATQKGGVGKTTLSIAFSNYATTEKDYNIVGVDFDYQESFYKKWENDDQLEIEPIYNVIKIDEIDQKDLLEYKKSESIYVIDIAGTLDDRYIDLLTLSDYIIIPFEYSDVSVESTLIFANLLQILDSEAERLFVKNRYDKGYNYPIKDYTNNEIARHGKLIEEPIYKRNVLQKINTRGLTYRQKKAVKNTFEKLFKIIEQ